MQSSCRTGLELAFSVKNSSDARMEIGMANPRERCFCIITIASEVNGCRGCWWIR